MFKKSYHQRPCVKLKLHHNKNRLGDSTPPQHLAGFQFISPSGLYCLASIVGPSGLRCGWFLFLVFKCWHVWVWKCLLPD